MFRYDRVLTIQLNHGMIRTEFLKGDLPSGRGRPCSRVAKVGWVFEIPKITKITHFTLRGSASSDGTAVLYMYYLLFYRDKSDDP